MTVSVSSCLRFLQRISTACRAERCTSYSKSICLSADLSDCLSHTGTESKWLTLQWFGLHCI